MPPLRAQGLNLARVAVNGAVLDVADGLLVKSRLARATAARASSRARLPPICLRQTHDAALPPSVHFRTLCHAPSHRNPPGPPLARDWVA